MTGDSWFPEIKGKTRTLTGRFAVVYSLTAAAFSLWYLYTSGFGLYSTETNRGFYLLFTSILVFLIFPARRGAPAHRPSVIDIVFIAAAIACIGYWMDQYVPYAMFRVSDPNGWDLTMGAIAIVVLLETTRTRGVDFGCDPLGDRLGRLSLGEDTKLDADKALAHSHVVSRDAAMGTRGVLLHPLGRRPGSTAVGPPLLRDRALRSSDDAGALPGPCPGR